MEESFNVGWKEMIDRGQLEVKWKQWNSCESRTYKSSCAPRHNKEVNQ